MSLSEDLHELEERCRKLEVQLLELVPKDDRASATPDAVSECELTNINLLSSPPTPSESDRKESLNLGSLPT